MSRQSLRNRRNRYKVIDQQKRLQIIDRIIAKGEQLKTVSQQIGINVSTCKAIVKVYQEEGRVGKKKTRNKVVDVVETYSFYTLDNSKLIQLCPLKIMNSKISVQNKQMVEDVIQNKCKQKADKMLTQAVETHKKIQQAMKQTQTSSSENLAFSSPGNYFSYGFFPQI